MKVKLAHTVKLGLFITIGLAFFIGIIYYLGSRENLFSSSIRITAYFESISGLKPGNNVRYNGIQIGTVKEIDVIAHDSIKVLMEIDQDLQKFIKIDSKAVIGTEGLMGYKVVDIGAGTPESPSVKDNGTIAAVKPIEMQELLETLQATSANVITITDRLVEISNMIGSGKGAIGKLIYDTTLSARLEDVMQNLEATTNNSATITGDLAEISGQVASGKGPLGKLINDTSMAMDMENAIKSLEQASDNSEKFAAELKEFGEKLNDSTNVIHKLTGDQQLAIDLVHTMDELQDGAEAFNSGASRIGDSFLFRLFFGGDSDDDEKKENDEKKKEKKIKRPRKLPEKRGSSSSSVPTGTTGEVGKQ